MFGKSAHERMKRKIEKLGKELSNAKQDNVALSSENKLLQRKYEEAVKRADDMSGSLEVSLNKYNDAMNQMREAKEEYETMISELRLLRQSYEKEMKLLFTSVRREIT